MKVGITLPTRAVVFGATSVDELLEVAREADASGHVESVWVGDSVANKARPDAVAFVAALSAVTRKVALGVGCMSSFVLRDPVVFAYQWASVDVISGGRTRLAVCTGLVPGSDTGAKFGVPRRERVARLEEGMAACRRLWTGEPVSFAGTFVKFGEVRTEPRPVQQPCPIWIASNPMPLASNTRRRTALRRVATTADGWMSGQYPPAFGDNWKMLAEELERAGRDPATFPNIAYHNVNIGADRSACLEETRRFMDAYYGPGVFTDEMICGQTAAGTPAECLAALRRLGDDGAKSVTLRPTSWHQLEQVRRLCNEVLPSLEDAA